MFVFIYLYLLVCDEMVSILVVGDTREDDMLGNYDVHEKNFENINFNYVINKLQLHLISKSHILNLICHLDLSPLVRAVLDLDVKLLENKFVIGYREDKRFCVFPL